MQWKHPSNKESNIPRGDMLITIHPREHCSLATVTTNVFVGRSKVPSNSKVPMVPDLGNLAPP